jgi:ribulose-phosphate 3-epimerase
MTSRIKPLREHRAWNALGAHYEVDGGIDATTTPLVVDAGAKVLVAGSAIFGHDEGVIVAMKRLRAAANQA